MAGTTTRATTLPGTRPPKPTAAEGSFTGPPGRFPLVRHGLDDDDLKLVKRTLETWGGEAVFSLLRIRTRAFLAVGWGITRPTVRDVPREDLVARRELAIHCEASGGQVGIGDFVRARGNLFAPPGWTIGDSRFRRFNIGRKHAYLEKNTYTWHGDHSLQGGTFHALDMGVARGLLDGSVEMIVEHGRVVPRRSRPG